MLTFDLLASLPRAEQGLGAYRWGIAPSTPRVLAARLLDPALAVRVARRGIDAGAPQLVPLLVEHGGATVPRSHALEPEAERLAGWFPMHATDEGWSVPRDYAAAAASVGERERFFAATLVARLDGTQRAALADALGLPAQSTASYRLQHTVERVATAAADPSLVAHAKALGTLQSIRASDIASVDVDLQSAGLKFTVRFVDGDSVNVCPREQAEALGERFNPVHVTTVAAVMTDREMPAVRVPAFQEIGALVRFSTSRAAEEAAALAEFRGVVARRIDDTTVATRPSFGPARARDLLLQLGFHVDTAEVL